MKKCMWTHEKPSYWMESECGAEQPVFEFEDDYAFNNYKFCPFCGKNIKWIITITTVKE